MSNAADGDYVRVASLAEVPPGALLDVEVNDEVLILVNTGGELHAVSAWCSHMGTSLALGTLSEYTLMCFAHLWRYDVRTGEPLWPPLAKVAPGYRLRVYPVRVDGDDVYISTTPRRGGRI